MSLSRCLVYSLGIKHQGLNLWGCPCQHVFSLLLKLLRVAYVFVKMSRLFVGDKASGVELMGMPMPTRIQSTFKTIKSGYHNCMFWELMAKRFLV